MLCGVEVDELIYNLYILTAESFPIVKSVTFNTKYEENSLLDYLEVHVCQMSKFVDSLKIPNYIWWHFYTPRSYENQWNVFLQSNVMLP